MLHAEIGILFGSKMGDKLLENRYGPLIGALGELGVEPVILRVKPEDYDLEKNTFTHYSKVVPGEGVTVHEEPVRVDLLRDFNMRRRYGDVPAINDLSVRQLFMDKASTREVLGDFMPNGIVLSESRSDAGDARHALSGKKVVVKPTVGLRSRGVSVVDRDNDDHWHDALAAIPPEKRVLVEEYVDTTRSPLATGAFAGRPSTTRIIAIDGEPSVVTARFGLPDDLMLNGDASEKNCYMDLETLTEEQLNIVQAVHRVAAEEGNGYSYVGVDLLESEATLLGEVNTRPVTILPAHNEVWSQRLAADAAQQLVRAHEQLTME